ncbi:MAG: hypothetical protein A2X94_03590 [Bdellovibrionales bacterium GWB1_55_8]|nr:MAG: hypothetical protein A2X94_03590 [Bdellovibrionales bacterium GWB1_55_8]
MDIQAKIIVRDAQLADAFGIARVHAAAWKDAYRGIVPDEILDQRSAETGVSRFVQHITAKTQSSTSFPFLVAVIETTVVGFCDARSPKESPPEFDCEIGALYVDPAFQHRGIGRALVVEAANRFRTSGYGAMIIWTFSENHSRGFYEKLGGRLLLETKLLPLGGKDLPLVAYGWSELSCLQNFHANS